MRTFFEATPHELLTTAETAIGGLEPRKNSPTAPQVRSMIDDAHGLFTETAKPRGVYQPITLAEFEQVYRGEGGNDDDTPLEHVVEDAVSLALFAVTLGEEVSQHISDFDAARLQQRSIAIGEHCFGCTAGAGSSCGGATT